MVKVTKELNSKYIDSTRFTALSRLLDRALETRETVDISDAKFVPKCANLLSPAYNSGVKIVGGAKLMMEILEENKRRYAVTEADYPNLIVLPTTSFDDATDFINDMDATKKWRVDCSKNGDPYYCAFIALILLIRNDVEVYLGTMAYYVMDMIHSYFANIDGYGKYYCICNGDVRVVERDTDTGKYDMGEYGLVDETQFRIRFKAVPYAYSNCEYPEEWEGPVLRPLLKRLHGKYTSNKGKSLYAFIGGKED